MRSWLWASFVFVVLLVVSVNAFAAVCIKVDTDLDNLEGDEAVAVKVLVEGSLRKDGLEVVRAPCGEMYTIYSVRLGRSMTATVSGAGETRDRKVRDVEELPLAYKRLIYSLMNDEIDDLEGDRGRESEVDNGYDIQDSRQVVREHDKNVRHGLIYVKGSLGAILGDGGAGGLGFGLGGRYRFDRGGFDISIVNVFKGEERVGQASLIRAGGMVYFSPEERGSGYLNAGLSYGFTQVGGLKGEGPQAEIGLGYEFARASVISPLLEVNFVLPLYTPSVLWIEQYLTTFEISFGFGF